MLGVTSQHALRALVHLSRVPMGESVLGRDLAAAADVPANFLSKIMLTLRRAGLVEATRGHGGGYRLVRSPREIPLIQVVALFEGTTNKPCCILGEKHMCSDASACTAHAGWRAVSQAYYEFLNSNTIAQIGRQHTGAAWLPPGSSVQGNGSNGEHEHRS